MYYVLYIHECIYKGRPKKEISKNFRINLDEAILKIQNKIHLYYSLKHHCHGMCN